MDEVLLRMAFLDTWSPDLAALSGPAHTWVSESDVSTLRAEVTAVGWLWRRIDHVDDDAQVLAEVFDRLVRRERENVPRNTPGAPHVMLAVGPDMPWHLRELMLIASMGRAHDVHLAVGAAAFGRAGQHPHHPIEFHDNIGGWYGGRPGLDNSNPVR
ncbi:hypothetical protein [Mycobacterium avium]|uniref:Uncharacterized protein n=1 Tax=Mycobacterium avium subsp. hominissuis TaxID=439334 RepID=A0AAI8ST98_MYCAV|nr:hypothetical protein [Mycobacterium avium]PBA08649.1 hypothetical protein CKJ70_25325 [Mycobacterium avium]BBN50817.1 hypothetical protein JPH1_52920 [Mycobacterium avium subsp. hominissuis]